MISINKMFEVMFQVPLSLANLDKVHQQRINKMTGKTSLNKANRIATGTMPMQSNYGQLMQGKVRAKPHFQMKSLNNAYP